MDTSSDRVAAAFPHRCRSATGSDRSPADARSSVVRGGIGRRPRGGACFAAKGGHAVGRLSGLIARCSLRYPSQEHTEIGGHPACEREEAPRQGAPLTLLGSRYRIWPRISPPGKSPGPVFGGATPSLVCTLTYVLPLSIAARIAARSVHPQALPGSGAVIVPSASVPSTRPPAGAPAKSVTPTGPLTPPAPQWMCDANTLSMFATVTLNSSAVPSLLSLNVATPTARVSRAGTSWSPLSVATKLSPARAVGASASASITASRIALRIPPPLGSCTWRLGCGRKRWHGAPDASMPDTPSIARAELGAQQHADGDLPDDCFGHRKGASAHTCSAPKGRP